VQLLSLCFRNMYRCVATGGGFEGVQTPPPYTSHSGTQNIEKLLGCRELTVSNLILLCVITVAISWAAIPIEDTATVTTVLNEDQSEQSGQFQVATVVNEDKGDQFQPMQVITILVS